MHELYVPAGLTGPLTTTANADTKPTHPTFLRAAKRTSVREGAGKAEDGPSCTPGGNGSQGFPP